MKHNSTHAHGLTVFNLAVTSVNPWSDCCEAATKFFKSVDGDGDCLGRANGRTATGNFEQFR